MQEDIFRLLVKKLSNELTYEESLKIDELIIKNSEVYNEYKLLQKVWQDTADRNILKNVNSINKIHTKIELFRKNRRKKTIKEGVKYFAAASLLIFAVVFMFTFKKTISIANDTGTIKTITLPDYSEITLDTNAVVSYQTNIFQNFNRKVNFTGNAFFSIKKLNGKTFTVTCNDLDIKVLGTKFNINQSSYNTIIALIEGKVKVLNFQKKSDTTVIMKPNEVVEYNNISGKIIHKTANTEVHTFWMKDKIEFNNYTIDELTQIFKMYYGKTIIFSDTMLKYKQIGGSAPSDDLFLILEALRLITNTEIQELNDTLYFN